MKTTISVSIWSLKQLLLTGSKTFDEILEIITELGVNHIDLMEDYIPCHPHTDLHELLQLKQKIASFGLVIPSCWFHTDLVGGIYLSSFERVVDDIKEYLAVTAALGAEFMCVPVGARVPGMNLEEGYNLLLRIFKKIIPTAEEYNVRIGLESSRTLGLKTPQIALKLVQALDSHYLTVTPDFEAWRTPTKDIPGFHVEIPGMKATEPLSIDVFKECLPYAPLIHAKLLTFDEKGEEPNFPIAEMMSLIKYSNHEHTLSIEYEGWIPDINPNLDPILETKKGIALLKRYLG
jgi:hypothetical protein